MDPLEFGRGSIPQERMSSAAVVEDLDVLEDISLGFPSCLVFTVVHQFGLEGVEEALHGGVVPAVPLAAHAAQHALGN